MHFVISHKCPLSKRFPNKGHFLVRDTSLFFLAIHRIEISLYYQCTIKQYVDFTIYKVNHKTEFLLFVVVEYEV